MSIIHLLMFNLIKGTKLGKAGFVAVYKYYVICAIMWYILIYEIAQIMCVATLILFTFYTLFYFVIVKLFPYALTFGLTPLYDRQIVYVLD